MQERRGIDQVGQPFPLGQRGQEKETTPVRRTSLVLAVLFAGEVLLCRKPVLAVRVQLGRGHCDAVGNNADARMSHVGVEPGVPLLRQDNHGVRGLAATSD